MLSASETWYARGSAPASPAPKFKVGDRVRFYGGEEYVVEAGPAWLLIKHGDRTKDHWHMEEDMELAPPEPPAPAWVYERGFDGWKVFRGPAGISSPISTLHSEALAIQVRDSLNAQDEVEE